MTTEQIEIAGTAIRYDASNGQGHKWVAATADNCPANVVEEIAAEILDNDARMCRDYVASNGQHYRW